MPKLEQMISIYHQARYDLPIHFSTVRPSLQDMLIRDHNLRQTLGKLRIERLWAKEGEESEGYLAIYQNPFIPQTEDIDFWKQALIEWCNEKPKIVKAVWEQLHRAWDSQEYQVSLLDWLEDLAFQNNSFTAIWNAWRVEDIPDNEHWMAKQTREKQIQKFKKETEKQNILAAIDKIHAGHAGGLNFLWSERHINGTKLEEKYGADLATAYLEGLFIFWQKVSLPPLSAYHTKSTLENKCLLTIEAVDLWTTSPGFSWQNTNEAMRRATLQAGLSALNNLPAWYPELAQLEPWLFYGLARTALTLEDFSQVKMCKFASMIRMLNNDPLIRQAAIDYLKDTPTANSLITWELIRAVDSEHLSHEKLELFHSPLMYFKICKRNRLSPRTPFIRPKTGSTVEGKRADRQRLLSVRIYK